MTQTRQTPPELAELTALFALAQREDDAGRLPEAAAAYRKMIALRPDVSATHYSLGNVLVSQGLLDEAAAQYQRALALKPDFFQAHNNLGNIFGSQGKLDQAVARHRQAIALRPDYAEAYYNLGNALSEQNQLDAAVAQYERAIALKPDFFNAYHNLGILFRKQGKLAQAVATFEQVLALKPDFAAARNGLGNTLKEQGSLAQALACFDEALVVNPDDADAHYDRRDLKTFRRDDADLAALEALAAEPDRLPPGKMLYIHFALGKALEDVGDDARAFEQWLQANALKRREVNYDEAAFQLEFRLVAELFDSTLLSRFQGVGDPSQTPIFVLGMPRSGSTLIEQILASHPQVQAAGELKNLGRVVKTVYNRDGRPIPYPACALALDADGLRRLGQAYLASLPRLAEGKQRIVDKMPMNFALIGLIRLILPNARIIHTMRDPVDTCVSCFSRAFTHGYLFSYDLAELGRYYRLYHELMAHWHAVLLAAAMLDVSYEDVVDNLEQQARRLIEYCGLPWDDRCLNFAETDRPIASASNIQARRPLYRSSVARWRRYEAYLQPLLAELDRCQQSEEKSR